MAVDKLVDSALLDAALGDIADVIRSKTGISGSFDFPSPNEIADVIDLYLLMPTGTKSITQNGTNIDVAQYSKVDVNVSGGGGEWTTVGIATGVEPSGEIVLNGISISNYTLAGNKRITRLVGNNLDLGSDTGQFSFMTGLISANVSCSSSGNSTSFASDSYLRTLVFKATNTNNNNSICQNCTRLGTADFNVSRLRPNSFYSCKALKTLILRRTSVITLDNISAFNDSPFASEKSGGTLYVPESLISSYQSASNWSTILGYTNNQIKSIESTHTDPTATIDLTLYYADGTPIPTT